MHIDDNDFYWYGSQSAGLVTNKVHCKLQKKKSNTKISNNSVN